MKSVVLFLALVFCGSIIAGAQQYSDFRIDQATENIMAPTPDSLAARLTRDYTTDREKVRSIFRWIADHIAYDIGRFRQAPTVVKYKAPAVPDTTYDSRSLTERVAYNVLKKRKAICYGYARLFQALCDYAGIRSTIITGYARTEGDHINTPFAANHSWNAVYLDSSWHLLDVTWASGYVTNYSDEFVQSFDGFYFLTPPEKFIRSHYPEDLQWTLLTDPPILREFGSAPFKPMAFLKYGIASFLPKSGVIEARVGDTIRIELTLPEIGKRLKIAANPQPDYTPSIGPSGWVNLQDPVTTGKKLLFTYVLTGKEIKWLNVVYNKDVVLRYRVEVKPPVFDPLPALGTTANR